MGLFETEVFHHYNNLHLDFAKSIYIFTATLCSTSGTSMERNSSKWQRGSSSRSILKLHYLLYWSNILEAAIQEKKIKYSGCRYIQYITYIFTKLQVNISPFLRTVFQNLVHLFSDKTTGGNSVASYGSDVLYGAFSCDLKRGLLEHSLSRQVFYAIDGCKHLNC